MYKLEITGDNVKDFYNDACNVLMLLVRGGQNMQQSGAVPAAAPAPQEQVAPPAEAAPVVAEPLPNPSVAPGSADPMADVITPPASSTAKRGRGRPPKAVVEAESADGGVPDFLQRTETTSAPLTDELTLDAHIRPRIRDINKAHTARLSTSGKPDADIAIECVNYIKKLFKEFDIAKAADLAVGKYAEFMAKSDAYLAGTA